MQVYSPSSLSVTSEMVRLSEPKANLKETSSPDEVSSAVRTAEKSRRPPVVVGQLVVVPQPGGGGHQRGVMFHSALKHRRATSLDDLVLQMLEQASGLWRREERVSLYTWDCF